jgi:hypothetical protein
MGDFKQAWVLIYHPLRIDFVHPARVLGQNQKPFDYVIAFFIYMGDRKQAWVPHVNEKSQMLEHLAFYSLVNPAGFEPATC